MVSASPPRAFRRVLEHRPNEEACEPSGTMPVGTSENDLRLYLGLERTERYWFSLR
jgi:hypothetical protein